MSSTARQGATDEAAGPARRAARRRAGGFTLIEILAALAILGLLMGLAVHFYGRQKEQGYAASTRAAMEQLRLAIARYESRKGDFPPDSLAKLKIRAPNDTNESIEALVAALHHKDFPEGVLLDEAILCNTDDDESATPFHRDPAVLKLLEVKDGWGNPIAYFPNSSYGKEAKIVMGDPTDPNDTEQTAKALRSSLTGTWANADGYQLISAGTDRIFGTEDDVTNVGH